MLIKYENIKTAWPRNTWGNSLGLRLGGFGLGHEEGVDSNTMLDMVISTESEMLVFLFSKKIYSPGCQV